MSKTENYECPTCGQVFLLKSCLKTHRLKHKKIKINTFDEFKDTTVFKEYENDKDKECSTGRLRDWSTLSEEHISRIEYLRSHLGNQELWNKYRCSVCSKGFLSKKSYDKHISIKHQPVKSSGENPVHKRKNVVTCLNDKKKLIPFANEKLIPSTNEKLIPSANEKLIPYAKEKLIPSVKEKLVPSAKEKMIPSAKEKLIPSEKDRLIPSTKEKLIPSTNQKGKYYTTCDICNKCFVLEKNLERHMFTHKYQQNPFCSICNKKFTTVNYLRLHFRKHELRDKYRCSFCRKGFLSQKSLDSHMTSKHPGKHHCPICMESFLEEIVMKEHMVKHKKLSCAVCSEIFPKLTDVSEHMIKHKNDFACVKCDKKFKSFKQLITHQEYHRHPDIQCEECGKIFNWKSYPVHVRVHTREKPHKCSKCGRFFSQLAHCRRHMKSHEKDFHCDICGIAISNKDILTEHYVRHFGNTNFECEICSVECDNYLDMNDHCQEHHPDAFISCQFCKKQFCNSVVLYTHYSTHSRKELKMLDPDIANLVSKIKCRVISKEKKYNRRLKVELKRYEIDDNGNFKCPYCPKTTKFRQVLEVHERKHTGEKPFKCGICNKTFAQIGHLTNHLTLHSGTKHFKCDVCGKAFATRDYLYNHKKIHSSDSKPRRIRKYKCCYCGQKQSNKSALLSHQSVCSSSTAISSPQLSSCETDALDNTYHETISIECDREEDSKIITIFEHTIVE